MIDWTRGYDFLDHEFQQIVRDANLGKRLADKLVKVWLKNGDEAILYIHVEVQAQHDAGFEQRMFVYHYRIFDRFNQPILSLAILGDSSPNWRPHCFGYEIGGCQLSFKFPIVKLVDYKERWEELEQSRNPFSVVVRTHLKGLETRHTPEQRFYWKKELYQALIKEGYHKQEILELFHFMDWMLRLPNELALQFKHFVEQYEAEKQVRYVTSIEKMARADGRADGQANLLIRLLAEKFGPLNPDVQATIHHLDENRLFEGVKRSLTAQTLQEVIG
jgi:hypothetical protein